MLSAVVEDKGKQQVMNSPDIARRRPRSLTLELVSSLSERIREGQLKVGDKIDRKSVV